MLRVNSITLKVHLFYYLILLSILLDINFIFLFFLILFYFLHE